MVLNTAHCIMIGSGVIVVTAVSGIAGYRAIKKYYKKRRAEIIANMLMKSLNLSKNK